MDLSAITDKGRVRKENQDSCYIYREEEHDLALLLVCDGMGGHNAGNVASSLAATVFAGEVKEGLANARVTGGFCNLMKGALRTANSAVYELGVTEPTCRGMGTTLVSAIVLGDDATVLNVGDSRAYHISADTIRRVTRDHSVVEDMVERGDITREESRTHPSKNLITRAVGTSPEVMADFFSVRLRQGDTLLLCSDGLSNTVTEEEMLFTVMGSSSVELAGRELMRLALERGAPDNVTAALYRR